MCANEQGPEVRRIRVGAGQHPRESVQKLFRQYFHRMANPEPD